MNIGTTLSNSRKAGYASVETGVTAFELLLQVYLLEFYIRGCGLNPLLASAGAAIAVTWDAISDPLMGYLSDRTGSRWLGKRGGYIVSGSILMGFTGIAVFNPPDSLVQNALNGAQWELFVWYLLSYLCVNTAMTIVTVPHIAVVGDFASDSKERNRFFGWRLLFSNLGLLLGIGVPVVFAKASDIMAARSQASVLFALILVFNSMICLGSIRKRDLESVESSLSESNKQIQGVIQLIASIFPALRNPYFLNLLAAFCLAAIARALNSSFALFYYKDALALDETRQVSLILLVFIVSIIMGIPMWLKLSDRFWKRRPAFFGVLMLALLTLLTYPFFPQGRMLGPLLMAVLGGIAVGAILLLESLVLDTIDYDELKTGKRRDGSYFGCLKMASKLARALGLAMTGPILIWVGYEVAAEIQPVHVADRLRVVFGVMVGSFFLLSAIVFSRFSLTREQHRQITKQLGREDLV